MELGLKKFVISECIALPLLWKELLEVESAAHRHDLGKKKKKENEVLRLERTVVAMRIQAGFVCKSGYGCKSE